MKNEKSMEKKRRFYLVLPLIVLPFVTGIFHILGGGSANAADGTGALNVKLNSELPDPKLDNKPRDKMSYYQQAEEDSLRWKRLQENDPHFKGFDEKNVFEGEYLTNGEIYIENEDGTDQPGQFGVVDGGYGNETADKIRRKLEEFDRQMRYEQQQVQSADTDETVNEDIERIERMMAEINTPKEDPEMDQISNVLDKVLDVQNPQRVQERLRKQSEERRGEVFAVTTVPQGTNVSLLDSGANAQAVGNGFYSMGSFDENISAANVGIRAAVHEEQTAVNGSTIKLRLLNDVYINGVHIPRDNFVFGTASLNGERLGITIESIRYRQRLFPVNLTVYDMDGLDGLYIPGSITRDVAKNSVDRPMNNIGISTIDNSWGAQAASAGVEVVKGLFSKKVKLVKVTVKAGYQVLLRDEKRKQREQ